MVKKYQRKIDHWCYNFEWVEHLDNYYDNSADIDLMSALSMSKEELNYGVEIIEELEDKEYDDIEELNYKYVNTYGNISQHRKSEEPLIDTINALIKNQKKIIEKLNKNSNTQ